MLIFQNHVIARPLESAVSSVNVLSLLFIFQDFAFGQGSQGQQSAMLMWWTCLELRYHLNGDMKVWLWEMGPFIPPFAILKPKVESF